MCTEWLAAGSDGLLYATCSWNSWEKVLGESLCIGKIGAFGINQSWVQILALLLPDSVTLGKPAPPSVVSTLLLTL